MGYGECLVILTEDFVISNFLGLPQSCQITNWQLKIFFISYHLVDLVCTYAARITKLCPAQASKAIIHSEMAQRQKDNQTQAIRRIFALLDHLQRKSKSVFSCMCVCS